MWVCVFCFRHFLRCVRLRVTPKINAKAENESESKHFGTMNKASVRFALFHAVSMDSKKKKTDAAGYWITDLRDRRKKQSKKTEMLTHNRGRGCCTFVSRLFWERVRLVSRNKSRTCARDPRTRSRLRSLIQHAPGGALTQRGLEICGKK